MKTIAYTALHYGKDYLGYAIRSIIDHVDEYHVLYTSKGSHGHRTNLVCPDSREELKAIARAAAGDKLTWHEGVWTQEGQHRDAIHELVPDADVVLVLDADEIWEKGLAEHVVLGSPFGKSRTYRIPIIHYWRSFRRCVLHDPAYPIRVILPKIENGEATIDTYQRINHMGYAIRPAMMYYKWQLHGHKNEMRDFDTWFDEVYLKNRQVDCHPIGSEWWNPEQVEPLDYMPEWMQEHPYWGKDVIE